MYSHHLYISIEEFQNYNAEYMIHMYIKHNAIFYEHIRINKGVFVEYGVCLKKPRSYINHDNLNGSANTKESIILLSNFIVFDAIH